MQFPVLAAMAALTAIPGQPQNGVPTWTLTQVDRTSLIAVDTNRIKLGISGAQSAMLVIVADPKPGKPTVIVSKFEFDCFAKKVSVNGGISETPGEQPTIDSSASEWEVPTPGSMLDKDLKYGCSGEAVPAGWQALPLNANELIDFYFVKVLGRQNPFASH